MCWVVWWVSLSGGVFTFYEFSVPPGDGVDIAIVGVLRVKFPGCVFLVIFSVDVVHPQLINIC